mgnify:CR=1 FL=1
MDLFEWSQNIMKVNQSKVINDSIKNVNNELWIQYLKNILRNNNVNSSIDEAFNKEISNNRINL